MGAWLVVVLLVALMFAGEAVAASRPAPRASQAAAYSETTGGSTHTWSDYTTAGGTAGQTIPGQTTVAVACRVSGFQVADGDTWWYEIASSPWNGAYYASADAFYNNGQTSGSLHGTPFYDPAVPICSSGSASAGGGSSTTPTPTPGARAETTGGLTHTWTDYHDAGGNEGQSIPAYASVEVACKVTGFQVADGDTWWYEIAGSPWNGAYYASADAFYNNGQTSGSLTNTPLVDPNVPTCASAPGPSQPPLKVTISPKSVTIAPTVRHEHVHAPVVLTWRWIGATTRLRAILLPSLPREARILVTCRGRGCPRRSWSATSDQLSRLRSLAGRSFRASDRLFITISVPGLIPERAEVVIRNGRKPTARLL